MKGIIVCAIALLSIVGIYFGMSVSYNNRDAELRNLVTAKQKDNENVFDATWKIIKQKAGVASQYKEDFKEIYPELISGRYGGDNGKMFMKWIQEHNPQFDTSLYKSLMVSIESQRVVFRDAQTRLLDIKREHDNLRTRFPSGWFLSNKSEVEVKIVTSTKTAETFAVGVEDDISLFDDEKGS